MRDYSNEIEKVKLAVSKGELEIAFINSIRLSDGTPVLNKFINLQREYQALSITRDKEEVLLQNFQKEKEVIVNSVLEAVDELSGYLNSNDFYKSNLVSEKLDEITELIKTQTKSIQFFLTISFGVFLTGLGIITFGIGGSEGSYETASTIGGSLISSFCVFPIDKIVKRRESNKVLKTIHKRINSCKDSKEFDSLSNLIQIKLEKML